MNQTPFEFVEGLRIGIVEFVSPDDIKVGLDIDSPDSIALNSGTPRVFPRVNSYLIIPNDEGYIVGQIEWITIEKSAFPKRRGMQDFGLIDIPFPQKKLSLNPLGTLIKKSHHNDSEYSFHRGVDSFPNIGDGVFLPSDGQLRSIVESGVNRRVNIGTSPLAGNAMVSVDPDRLFGRHLAILGNTGSGKSCSVAGIIRWSLEAAFKENEKSPNARFIILDPNGEYSRAFSKEEPGINARIFNVNPQQDGENLLNVPLWFWNSDEWCSFTQASDKTQKPTLHQALRNVRSCIFNESDTNKNQLKNYLMIHVKIFQIELSKGDIFHLFKGKINFCNILNSFNESLLYYACNLDGKEEESLQDIIKTIQLLRDKHVIVKDKGFIEYLNYSIPDIENLILVIEKAHYVLGGKPHNVKLADIDAPLEFNGEDLIKTIEATAEMLKVSAYAETLIMRINCLLSNTRMKSVIDSDFSEITLGKWLSDIIGDENGSNGTITIIDLSLVPTEIVHIVVSVIARLVFEALQRYRKVNTITLPTVLVMEEAHTYIKRYQETIENQNVASICCQVFERIAREGRKFGLGLVLSSQRPSELSPTVLSQCNTFLLHRITNDRDQDLIHRFLPDNLRGLLRELPSLPSQNAILLGWASEIPILVKMNDLPKQHQPYSEDPEYWNIWVKNYEQEDIKLKNWEEIANEWQGKI